VAAVSTGSVSVDPLWNGARLLVAGLMAALLVRAELGVRARLLPTGALDTGGRLVALYAAIESRP
jgi:hypothetical protein